MFYALSIKTLVSGCKGKRLPRILLDLFKHAFANMRHGCGRLLGLYSEGDHHACLKCLGLLLGLNMTIAINKKNCIMNILQNLVKIKVKLHIVLVGEKNDKVGLFARMLISCIFKLPQDIWSADNATFPPPCTWQITPASPLLSEGWQNRETVRDFVLRVHQCEWVILEQSASFWSLLPRTPGKTVAIVTERTILATTKKRKLNDFNIHSLCPCWRDELLCPLSVR